MSSTASPISRATLEASLKETFRGHARWPIGRAALHALIDMGLSNAEIAAYFSVDPDDVYMLREEHGLS
jgi:hypothetical protein